MEIDNAACKTSRGAGWSVCIFPNSSFGDMIPRHMAGGYLIFISDVWHTRGMPHSQDPGGTEEVTWEDSDSCGHESDAVTGGFAVSTARKKVRPARSDKAGRGGEISEFH